MSEGLKAAKVLPPHIRNASPVAEIEASPQLIGEKPRQLPQLKTGYTNEQVKAAMEIAEEHLPSTVTEAHAAQAAEMRRRWGGKWTIDAVCRSKSDTRPTPETATDDQCQRCVVRAQCLMPAVQTASERVFSSLVEIQLEGNFGGTTPEVRGQIAKQLNEMA